VQTCATSFVSVAYAEMLGCSPDDINGKRIVDVMGEEGLATILSHIEKVLEGETVEYENEVAFRGVGLRCLHVIYTPDKNEHGSVSVSSVGPRGVVENSEKHPAKKLKRVGIAGVATEGHPYSCSQPRNFIGGAR
jgi:hypothetical protein